MLEEVLLSRDVFLNVLTEEIFYFKQFQEEEKIDNPGTLSLSHFRFPVVILPVFRDLWVYDAVLRSESKNILHNL